MMDTIVSCFPEHLPQIYALFSKTLQDPESLAVRVSTLQALGRVAEYIELDEESSIVSTCTTLTSLPVNHPDFWPVHHRPRSSL